MLDYIFRLFENAPSPSQDPPFGTLLLFLQSVTFEAFKSSLRTHFFQKYNIFTNQVNFSAHYLSLSASSLSMHFVHLCHDVICLLMHGFLFIVTIVLF